MEKYCYTMYKKLKNIMNRRKLFKDLNELCKNLDVDYNINSGGCCFVAAVLAEQFENYNIPFTVIHYGWIRCHYAIRVKDRIINRSDFSSKEIVYDKLMNSDCLYDIYENETWNTIYDVEDNSIVESEIKSLFKEYENRRSR